jgi:hypothetical protein
MYVSIMNTNYNSSLEKIMDTKAFEIGAIMALF